MNIYTLNVGQGQFVVVTGDTDAVIIDSHVPLDASQPVVNVKRALAKALAGKNLVGFIATGFDADHFNEVGLKIILNKYRPKWFMYPKYFKGTDEADKCFKVISDYRLTNDLSKISVLLDDASKRFYTKLSVDLQFELFSPHPADMDSSNNCSLVCKVREQSTSATYLVTGDTENARWDSIVRYFGGSVEAHVLAAPHHGSRNGITVAAMGHIRPHTVLVSAGVGNQYGHPHDEAVRLLMRYSRKCYCTNTDGGQSLHTTVDSSGIKTNLFMPYQ